MITPPPERNWAYAELVVGLDLIRPFLAGMGLAGIDPDGLREASRRAFDEERAAADPPPPSRSWPEHVERTLGSAARVRVERWVQTVFEVAPSDHQDWVAWHSTFAVVGRTVEGFVSLGIPPAKAAVLLPHYLESQDDRALYALEETVRGADLSLWDLEICSVHAMMPDEIDSLLWLWSRGASRNYRFQKFFAVLTATLDPDEMETLWQRGRAVRLRSHLDVDRLSDPRTLQPLDRPGAA